IQKWVTALKNAEKNSDRQPITAERIPELLYEELKARDAAKRAAKRGIPDQTAIPVMNIHYHGPSDLPHQPIYSMKPPVQSSPLALSLPENVPRDVLLRAFFEWERTKVENPDWLASLKEAEIALCREQVTIEQIAASSLEQLCDLGLSKGLSWSLPKDVSRFL